MYNKDLLLSEEVYDQKINQRQEQSWKQVDRLAVFNVQNAEAGRRD